MKRAPVPLNESERLAALKRFEILDSENEKQFDDLTQLASFICGTSISLVSLIDSERQWFKAKKGLDVNETPRDISFCGHAIMENEVMVINDATKDERFYDNPFVTEGLKIRFYAGAPLVDKNGFKLGTLCAIDSRPKTLTPEQVDALKKLSSIVVAQMELRLQLKHQLEREEFLKSSSLRLLQSAKMATLGEMASGVAHEINNPLAIIQGKTYLLKRMADNKELSVEALKENLGRIEVTTDRISKIVKGLLNFSRDTNASQSVKANLNDIIQNTLVLCEERFKLNDIEFKYVSSNSALIQCNPVQLSQAILNLLNNAYDAVVGTQKAWIQLDVKTEEKFILISVRDSGSNISEDVIEKMMNPFFTTKELGKGTGLGLSISKGLIEGHGGELFFDKNSSHTTFVIKIPKV